VLHQAACAEAIRFHLQLQHMHAHHGSRWTVFQRRLDTLHPASLAAHLHPVLHCRKALVASLAAAANINSSDIDIIVILPSQLAHSVARIALLQTASAGPMRVPAATPGTLL
jgi:hypothetical protein